MTIRDFQFSFTDTNAGATASIVGVAGTYIAPNSIDTAPLGAFMSELNPSDTQLSANVNAYRDLGGGSRMWLMIDWLVAPTGGTSVDIQLITSASSSLSAPVVIYDFGVQVIATLTGPTPYGKNVRQIAALPRTTAWLEFLGVQAVTVGTMTNGAFNAAIVWDIDSVDLGAASGFAIK